MKIIIIAGSIILPVVMLYLQSRWRYLRLIFNVVAYLALLVFGNIASLSIYKIIKSKTVFMTDIHAIFLNPLFLITGTYIGIYALYQLLLIKIISVK